MGQVLYAALLHIIILLFNMNIRKIPRFYFRYNLGFIFFLFIANFLGAYGQLVKRIPFKIDSLFALNVEQNIPTFYSGIILLFSSLLLLITHFTLKKEKIFFKSYPVFLSLIFLFLSYDEMFQIHERLTDPLQEILILNNNIFLRYTWVIPYSFFVIIVSLLGINFLRKLPNKVSRLIILSGCIYIFGELILEIFASMIDFYKLQNKESFYYLFTSYFLSSLEELLGMFGISLFNYSLLKLILNSENSYILRIQKKSDI